MSNIKVPRSRYSNLTKYSLNNNIYVSSTQKPIYSPIIGNHVKECYVKEELGSFSISAAVRPPYNCCRGCGDCSKDTLVGVS